MINRACLIVVLVVVGALAMTSCGGGGGSNINVTITTDVSNIETFQTVQFAATVTGTSNTAVTWQLSCTAAGSVCGTLSATGLYVAPNTVPTVATTTSTNAAVLTVTAISQANAAAGAIVQFTIDSLNQQPLTAPVQLGSSGSNVAATCGTGANEFCFGGTLGSLLLRHMVTANSFVLSNNHVLGLSDGGAAGQDVTQPGEIETNCATAGTITVANVVGHHKSPDRQPAPKVDVTTAQIIAGASESYRRYIGTGPARRRQWSSSPTAGASSRRFGPSRYCRRTARQKRTHHRSYLRYRRTRNVSVQSSRMRRAAQQPRRFKSPTPTRS